MKIRDSLGMTFYLLAGLSGFVTAPQTRASPAEITDRNAIPLLAQNQSEALRKTISRQELEALNQKLREAMSLYYDRSYRLALPLFKEIAARLDAIDVLYWLGRTAYGVQDWDLAIEQFSEILRRDPSLLPVRIELASAYLKKHEVAEAKNQLGILLDQNPSENLRISAQELLARLEDSDKRLFSSVRASIGTQYDDNVNIALNNNTSTIILENGATLTPQQQLNGWFVQSNLNGDLLYDFGERDGFVWRSQLSFLHNEYVDPPRDNFNYSLINLQNGVEYYSDQFTGKLPFGFLDQRFSNRDLSHTFYLAPNLEYNLSDELSVFLGYRFASEDFVFPGTNPQDNYTNTGFFGPKYSFKTGDISHVITLQATVSSRNAEAVRFSYDDWSIGPSYYLRFNTGTELYFEGRYLDRDYQAPALLFNNLGDRRDDRFSASVVLSQDFMKHFFVNATFTYIRNKSNVPVFDYEKLLAGLNIGLNYDF